MNQGTTTWQKLRLLISQFLKSTWLFFPGIVFLLLGIACFWVSGQGKDIILAFGSNKARVVHIGILNWNYSRIVFFIGIGFWVYVSWYSSRIIYYIKIQKQLEPIEEIQNSADTKVDKEGKSYPDIHQNILIEFPRMIGNACFLILELALLQSPLMLSQMSMLLAFTLLVLLLVAFYFLNKWIVSSFSYNKLYWPLFTYVSIAFLLSLVITSFLDKVFIGLFCQILVLHIIYIIYTNLHRKDMRSTQQVLNTAAPKLIQMIMKFFCIPIKESGYFSWFIYTCSAGISIYIVAINSFYFARGIGPFSFILLAFAVLLSFGNLVTALSVKSKINYHFILFILTLIFGIVENHQVRVKLKNPGTVARPKLEKYLRAWLKNYTSKDSGEIKMYFVMSNGGASRSGYWSAAVLGRIQDSTTSQNQKIFSDHLFALSGTSGGGVGVASYFSILKRSEINNRPNYESSLKEFLKQDYFTYTFAGLLGPDYFHYLLFFIRGNDRAGKLEESFENSGNLNDSLRHIPFDEDFSDFSALDKNEDLNLPLLFINTTRTQDGNPGVVSNLQIDSGTFNNRVDVVGLLDKTNSDVSLATAAILGARFPYLSPAGKINDSYFVDGGYFDNSGAGVVQELIRGIINIGKKEKDSAGSLSSQIARIHYHVLHIVNSPEIYDSSDLKSISPIKNDLMAPVLTILGAYNMQTTVNDRRLINYLDDLKKYEHISTNYRRISLYKIDNESHEQKKEEPYAMNWFISDSTLTRINMRLVQNGSLKDAICELTH
jgi:hypothetical protein